MVGRTRLGSIRLTAINSQWGEEENGRSAYCGGFEDRIASLKEFRMSKTVGTRGRGTSCGTGVKLSKGIAGRAS